MRQSLTRDLTFSNEDRDRNIERVTFVAKLLTCNGVVVLASFISPYAQTRGTSRREIGEFLEVYVHAAMETLVERDIKGLYKKALAGEIRNFTGVDDPYEAPISPMLSLDTDRLSAEECAARVIALLEQENYIDRQSDAPARTLQRDLCEEELPKSTDLPGAILPHGGRLIDRELKPSDRT